MYIEAVSVAV